MTPALQLGAAIAELHDGTKLFIIDRLTGSGSLTHIERITLGVPSSPYHSAEAAFNYHPRQGLFQTVPVYVALPLSTEGYPVKPGQLAVIVGDRPYVAGTVTLPGRKLLVRYTYDVSTASVDLAKAEEWFDVDGNGQLDLAFNSPERGVPKNAQPIFNVGSIGLQTASIDLGNNTVVLKQVPFVAERIPLVLGGKVPNFPYRDFSGQQHNLSEIKAKYILLDFWASWCIPCVADLPSKRAAYQRFHNRGFEILGMDDDADLAKPQILLKNTQATWPEVKPDPSLLSGRFNITAWPTLILIDQNGRIVSTNQTDHLPLAGPELEQTLDTLLR